MINIEIAPGFGGVISSDLIELAAFETFQQQAVVDADLTLVFTDDAVIRELNRHYLGKDAPTDVLSFPASENDPETGHRYIGDVIISLPRAQEQAADAGHSLQAEVQLLVVHGLLHLLGQDHAEEEEKARMWATQSQILEHLGLGHIRVRE